MKQIISKEDFVEIIDLIQKQQQKDIEFANFMEKYLDGRFIPTMNDYLTLALEKLFCYVFDDSEFSDDSWISWFMYDNEFGKKEHSVYLNEREYNIDSPETFYDFLIKWTEHKKKQNKVNAPPPELPPLRTIVEGKEPPKPESMK